MRFQVSSCSFKFVRSRAFAVIIPWTVGPEAATLQITINFSDNGGVDLLQKVDNQNSLASVVLAME